MTRRKHFGLATNYVRNTLDAAVGTADQIHEKEAKLITILKEIDENKFYVRYGYNSLLGFCCNRLRFTKTQSLRIATQVRRGDPMVNLGIKGDGPASSG